MKNVAIKLKNVSKKYYLKSGKPTLSETVLSGGKQNEFWALRDINLIVKKGEKVGLIGPNGAGKTTLLEIIAGITTPTEGIVKTDGKLISLIELGAGFHSELTGRENILINGMIIGMSKEELGKKLNGIMRFADIGKFIDHPLYTYSSGMKLRLGFSIATSADPDILILDEGLSSGDEKFHDKAMKKVEQLFKAQKTIVMSSHWMDYLKKYCNRIAWISNGKIVMSGEPKTVSERYIRKMS